MRNTLMCFLIRKGEAGGLMIEEEVGDEQHPSLLSFPYGEPEALREWIWLCNNEVLTNWSTNIQLMSWGKQSE